MIDVCAYGTNHDATVFAASDFGKSRVYNTPELKVPRHALLPFQTEKIQFLHGGGRGRYLVNWEINL